MELYIVQYYGDIGEIPARVCYKLGEALLLIKNQFGVQTRNEYGDLEWNYPDPEDDRIVVWKAVPGEVMTVAWHFSGWHFAGDASDLPGGPLEQGTLPGFSDSLYHCAMAE
jgi:hypothetical protein